VTHAAPATTYDVVTAVWGAEFIDLFLNLCIANQLSPGNLPALPAGSRYRIFTAAADAPRLTADARLDAVRRVLPVDIVDVDMTDADRHVKAGQPFNVHKRMIACHRRAAADAAASGRALIFLAPDFVLGEGTIAGLVRIHVGGARAVLTMNLRLTREAFLAALTSSEDRAALAPRDLVRVAMRHLHPWTASLFADSPSPSDNPTSIYWPIRSGGALEGLLVRSFYLHPMLVDPVLRAELPGGPIDSHYVRHCVPDVAHCYVVQDSDELIVFELSPSGRVIGNQVRRRGVAPVRLAAIAAGCNGHQLSHWEHSIRLHGGEFDARWTDAEQAAAALARAVARYRVAGPVLVAMYEGLRTWRRRRDAYETTFRKARRRSARAVRTALQRRQAYARALGKTLRPRVTAKQVTRPAKLLVHRAAKAGRLRLKRIRRSLGLALSV
jgi:hypothetical protein